MKGIIISLVLGLACASAWATKPAESPEQIAHPAKTHMHNDKCGHAAVKHDTHTDYVENGAYHSAHADHFDKHGTAISSNDPAARNVASDTHFTVNENGHAHGDKCGHKKVAHADHFDYIHDGQYHSTHADHSDNHGTL